MKLFSPAPLLCMVLVVFATACSTDLDCSLNGACTNGACVCNKPWKDSDNGLEHCSVLDTLPHPDDYVPAFGGVNRTSTAYEVQNISSWGGNILQTEDGLYHLFVSTLGNGSKPTGLAAWGHESYINHAVAKDPMDAFELRDTSLPVEAHNASPLRARNGSFLLFDIRSFLHYANDPSGPWIKLPSAGCNNPAPAYHPNGTMYVMCHNGGISIIRSDDVFAGNWTDVVSLKIPANWSAPSMRVEDPYLWFDANGNWHFLSHRFDYAQGPNYTAPLLVSGHGFSQDGLEWGFNVEQQPFPGVISFTNGTAQQCSTFERPHLMFNKAGTPTHLLSAVNPFYADANGDHCTLCRGHSPYSTHACVACKTTADVDYTFTLVTALNV